MIDGRSINDLETETGGSTYLPPLLWGNTRLKLT